MFDTALDDKFEWEREVLRREKIDITDLPPPLPHPDQVKINIPRKRLPMLVRRAWRGRNGILIVQNRWPVEPDAVDVLREAFEREAWLDDEGIVPACEVTLDDGDVVDIGKLAQGERPAWPWAKLISPTQVVQFEC